MKKQFLFLKGLTLLETLVSITIISLVIIGPLAYITASSSYARQSKNVITATYLAEEAIELLQNYYDSLYLFCRGQSGLNPCIPATFSAESDAQMAWRLFKERLSADGSYPSCFSKKGSIVDNELGCSFDYIDMINQPVDQPLTSTSSRYLPNAQECPYIMLTASSTFPSYVCSGIPSRTEGKKTTTFFKRVITLEQMPTFENPDNIPWNYQDHDDVRINVEVFYRATNGATRSVKITRFIHPRV